MAHILLVEDSPTDTRVFTTMLERNGHRVSVAVSAEDGLELARRDKPDLVMMDIILPGMNGFQATRALSRDPETEHIPVIIVSTKGMETDKVCGRRQGAKDYVVKPPEEKDLLRRIDMLIAQAQAG